MRHLIHVNCIAHHLTGSHHQLWWNLKPPITRIYASVRSQVKDCGEERNWNGSHVSQSNMKTVYNSSSFLGLLGCEIEEQKSEIRDGPKHLEPPKYRSKRKGKPVLPYLPVTHPVEILVFFFFSPFVTMTILFSYSIYSPYYLSPCSFDEYPPSNIKMKTFSFIMIGIEIKSWIWEQ